jgi:hypothetical protein
MLNRASLKLYAINAKIKESYAYNILEDIKE